MFHYCEVEMRSVQFVRELLFISREPVKQRWDALQNSHGIPLDAGAQVFGMRAEIEAHYPDVVMLPQVFQ